MKLQNLEPPGESCMLALSWLNHLRAKKHDEEDNGDDDDDDENDDVDDQALPLENQHLDPLCRSCVLAHSWLNYFGEASQLKLQNSEPSGESCMLALSWLIHLRAFLHEGTLVYIYI